MREDHVRDVVRIIGGFFCALLTVAALSAAAWARDGYDGYGKFAAAAARDSYDGYGEFAAAAARDSYDGYGKFAATAARDSYDSYGEFEPASALDSYGKPGMEPEPPPLELYATSAVLLDADSGRVLYEKNGYEPMAMASTTKIMTCILILEEGCPDDVAEVSAYAASMPKVKLYVRKGEQYRVGDLLYSLMLESHNDTAVVLAEYLGKKYLPEELMEKSTAEYTLEESGQAVKAFAARMNGKARELGCENTWFITPNGLDATETLQTQSGESLEREHCTTAAELARIMAYCVQKSPARDSFRRITGAGSYSFSANGRSYTLNNHNAFLNMMDGAFSGKTGFTGKAGYCYVGALERDGRTFIAAMLACGWPNNKTYKWSDTRKLMTYGIENYTFRNFLGEETAYREESLRPLPVRNGQTNALGSVAYTGVGILERQDGKQSAGMLMRKDEVVEVECSVKRSLKAPVAAGTVVGNIFYRVDGQVYYTETVVTTDDVEAVDWRWCVRQVWGRFAL